MRLPVLLAVIVALASTSFIVEAADMTNAPHQGTWYAQGGVALVDFKTDAALSASGIPLTGSNVEADDNFAVALGIGYFITPEISVLGVIGLPPTTTVTGRGALISGAEIGEITYGPAALTLNYHVPRLGAVQPFIGAGVNFTAVLDEKDGILQKLNVENAWGYVLRGGVELMMTEHLGLFISTQKIFVNTKATGTIDGAAFGAPGVPIAVSADIDLNPWVTHAGVVCRF